MESTVESGGSTCGVFCAPEDEALRTRPSSRALQRVNAGMVRESDDLEREWVEPANPSVKQPYFARRSASPQERGVVDDEHRDGKRRITLRRPAVPALSLASGMSTVMLAARAAQHQIVGQPVGTLVGYLVGQLLGTLVRMLTGQIVGKPAVADGATVDARSLARWEAPAPPTSQPAPVSVEP
jgi:hypothetical protein